MNPENKIVIGPKSFDILVAFTEYCTNNPEMGFYDCLQWFIKNEHPHIEDVFVCLDNEVCYPVKRLDAPSLDEEK